MRVERAYWSAKVFLGSGPGWLMKTEVPSAASGPGLTIVRRTLTRHGSPPSSAASSSEEALSLYVRHPLATLDGLG